MARDLSPLLGNNLRHVGAGGLEDLLCVLDLRCQNIGSHDGELLDPLANTLYLLFQLRSDECSALQVVLARQFGSGSDDRSCSAIRIGCDEWFSKRRSPANGV